MAYLHKIKAVAVAAMVFTFSFFAFSCMTDIESAEQVLGARNYSSSSLLSGLVFCQFPNKCEQVSAAACEPLGGEVVAFCQGASSSSSLVGVSSSSGGSSSSSSAVSSSSSLQSTFCIFTYDGKCDYTSLDMCNALGTPVQSCPSSSSVALSSSSSLPGGLVFCQFPNKCEQVSAAACEPLGGTVVDFCPGASSSSSAIGGGSCTANDNTQTHYCSEGTMKAYGSVTDSRENPAKTYKTVKIGTQTWMAENLNYATSNSRCYGDDTGGDSQNNCNTYGRLYDWNTTICPTSWHLPSQVEWNTMITYIGGAETGGKKLKATSGWSDYSSSSGNGTDDYGFSALSGGGGYSGGNFGSINNSGFWWSSTQNDSKNAYNYSMHYNRERTEQGNGADKNSLYSVRCVQD